MGIVAASLTAGAAVPASVVPRKRLVHRAIVAVNKYMHTGIVIRRAVPAVNEHRCLGLRAIILSSVINVRLYGVRIALEKMMVLSILRESGQNKK